MNNTYAKAYTEVIEIINHFSEEEYKKIPKEKIEYYENNKDKNYIFKIDPNIDLDKQNISKKAYSILVSLFRDYFATDRQKQILDDLLMQNEQKLEEEKLIKYAAELLCKIPTIIYGNYNENTLFAPVLSFNLHGVESEQIADYLSRNNIAVRGGLQCAPVAHKTLGTSEQGTVRISTSVYNSAEDIEKLCFFVKKFAFSY
jgi:hypothetical protein